VSVDIKFCGLTRDDDAAYAAFLGAAYVGVIFAGGQRMVTLDAAEALLAPLPREVQRVGVFAEQSPAEIARYAGRLSLSVVQLHAVRDATRVLDVRSAFGGTIWPTVSAKDGMLPPGAVELMDAAGALMLDAHVAGGLGGTGDELPWASLADEIRALRARRGGSIILAGGLRPENVASAIAALSPDVVDVSSGVERAPGIKDHVRMRAFRDAVSHASIFT
jgi:phosphoribosylanthranilate isomerase